MAAYDIVIRNGQVADGTGKRLFAADVALKGDRIAAVEAPGSLKGDNEIDATGKVVWEHVPPSIAVIFQVLPNGNVLYAYGGKPTGVREVNRKGQEVWNYVSKSPQVLGCERLENGTLIAWILMNCFWMLHELAAWPFYLVYIPMFIGLLLGLNLLVTKVLK